MSKNLMDEFKEQIDWLYDNDKNALYQVKEELEKIINSKKQADREVK